LTRASRGLQKKIATLPPRDLSRKRAGEVQSSRVLPQLCKGLLPGGEGLCLSTVSIDTRIFYRAAIHPTLRVRRAERRRHSRKKKTPGRIEIHRLRRFRRFRNQA